MHPDNKIESVSYEPRPARRRAQAPATTPETVAPAVIETVPMAAPEQVAVSSQPASVKERAAVVERQPWLPTPVEAEANTDGPGASQLLGLEGAAGHRCGSAAGSCACVGGSTDPAQLERDFLPCQRTFPGTCKERLAGVPHQPWIPHGTFG